MIAKKEKKKRQKKCAKEKGKNEQLPMSTETNPMFLLSYIKIKYSYNLLLPFEQKHTMNC